MPPRKPKPKLPMTPTEKDFFDWVSAYLRKHEVAPSTQRIADEFGITKSRVSAVVKNLCDKGWLTRTSKKFSLQVAA